jgi:hypothetical protein
VWWLYYYISRISMDRHFFSSIFLRRPKSFCRTVSDEKRFSHDTFDDIVPSISELVGTHWLNWSNPLHCLCNTFKVRLIVLFLLYWKLLVAAGAIAGPFYAWNASTHILLPSAHIFLMSLYRTDIHDKDEGPHFISSCRCIKESKWRVLQEWVLSLSSGKNEDIWHL